MPAPVIPLPKPTPLPLRPFRAVRYDAHRVGDPSELLAPPYDDLDPARVRALRRHPHHVARLLYADAPQDAAREPRRWLRRGVLRRDERPTLYVYQQRRGARILPRGVIGDLLLPRRPGQLLPHEDVSAHVVRQRATHMSGLRAQLEPLLLAHRGMESATARLVDHVTRRTPVALARIGQITHTLWSAMTRRNSHPSPVACPSGRHSSPTATTATPPASSSAETRQARGPAASPCWSTPRRALCGSPRSTECCRHCNRRRPRRTAAEVARVLPLVAPFECARRGCAAR
jgi:hypothetical protein